MARLLPRRSSTSVGRRDPRVVDIADEDAGAVLSALSSETARELYAAVQAEPGTPSDLAEAIDTSIQNVRYHLDNMEEAGLIEVVDTWYSSRGNEMSVYAAVDGPLILASDRSTAERLKGAVARLVGAVAILAALSALVHVTLVRLFAEEEPAESTGNGLQVASEPDPTGGTTAETVVSTVPPGVLFFAGGALVVVAVTALWYRRTY